MITNFRNLSEHTKEAQQIPTKINPKRLTKIPCSQRQGENPESSKTNWPVTYKGVPIRLSDFSEETL